MKSIFTVVSYPSTPKKLSYLKDCLKSLKGLDFDILLSTNYKINDPEIYELVDYFYYDKTDIKSLADYGLFYGEGWWLYGPNFKATLSFDNAYHFDIFRSVYSSLTIAKGLGYDFFYYVEGDSLLKNKDNIIKYRDQMFSDNKKIVFAEAVISEVETGYMTNIFGGAPNYFLEATSNIPHEIEGWISDSRYYGLSLENIFYRDIIEKDKIFKVDYNEFYYSLEPNKSRKVDDYGFKLMFFYNESNGGIYILIHNNSNEHVSKSIIEIDNVPWIVRDLGPRNYYIELVDINNILDKKIKHTVSFNDDIMIFERFFNNDELDKIKKSQKIIFTQ